MWVESRGKIWVKLQIRSVPHEKSKKTALSSLGFPTFCMMNSVKMVKELLEMPEFRFQNIPGRDAFVELIT